MALDIEAVAEQVFVALADPTRRSILAALATDGPSTATDLAARLPITRQAIAKHLALMADAGLVTPEPGERRRVRYRLQSAPVQLAQQMGPKAFLIFHLFFGAATLCLLVNPFYWALTAVWFVTHFAPIETIFPVFSTQRPRSFSGSSRRHQGTGER